VDPLRLLAQRLARLARGPDAAESAPEAPPDAPPAPAPFFAQDAFEPARSTPSTPGPKSLAAAFRADRFSGFVDGFEGAVKPPVDLSGGLEPVVPEVFELMKPPPVAVSTGFSASLDDLVGSLEDVVGPPIGLEVEPGVAASGPGVDSSEAAPALEQDGAAVAQLGGAEGLGVVAGEHAPSVEGPAAGESVASVGATESAVEGPAPGEVVPSAGPAAPTDGALAEPGVDELVPALLDRAEPHDGVEQIGEPLPPPLSAGSPEVAESSSSTTSEPTEDLIALAEVLVGGPRETSAAAGEPGVLETKPEEHARPVAAEADTTAGQVLGPWHEERAVVSTDAVVVEAPRVATSEDPADRAHIGATRETRPSPVGVELGVPETTPEDLTRPVAAGAERTAAGRALHEQHAVASTDAVMVEVPRAATSEEPSR
jgi:hypothetical protein